MHLLLAVVLAIFSIFAAALAYAQIATRGLTAPGAPKP